MNELSWLEINLSRLDANLAWWRGVLRCGHLTKRPTVQVPDESGVETRPPGHWATGPLPKFCAVVKANAYGLGAVPIAQRLEQQGIDMLAVYTPAQAEELIEAQVRTPIFVLQPTRELDRTASVRDAAVAGRLHLAINAPEQLSTVDLLGRAFDCRIPAHLHVDTGMSRAGLSQAQFLTMLGDLPRYRYVTLAGIWSHLASAGDNVEFADEQLSRLNQALDAARGKLPDPAESPDGGWLVHIGATHAACRHQRFHRGMVRIGLGLYGYGPELVTDGPTLAGAEDGEMLQPVLRWLARIIHIQSYPRGATVGYGCTHRLERDSILGVVPVGYADGYPQSLGNKARVGLITRTYVGPRGGLGPIMLPVVGAVSMDQIVIDLTPAPGLTGPAVVEPGAVVELVSNDASSPLSLPNLARTAGTSPYEMLCRLSPRLPRTYVSVEVATQVAAAASDDALQRVTQTVG